jgi:phage head maturation protease
MSFGFTVAGDEWETNEDTGRELRTITKIGRLFDVSPVTFPANPNTDVALRSRELAEAPKEAEAEADAQFGNRRRLDLL